MNLTTLGIGMAIKQYLKTAEGLVDIHLPQLRATENLYQSKLWTYLKGNSDVLKYLVAEMYARCLSTRDIEEMSPMKMAAV
jgi:hypothetical protein